MEMTRENEMANATGRQTEYLSATETAKLVRKALKSQFPGVRFSVRSKSHTGGASINVSWTDGPREATVRPVVQQYEAGGFDPSIDMAYDRTHYLRADGEVLLHHDVGTEISGGQHRSTDNTQLESVMPDGIRVVHFGAQHVSCTRHLSQHEAWTAEATDWAYGYLHIQGPYGADATGNSYRDLFGDRYISQIISSLVHDHEDGETWKATWDRCNA